MPRVTDLLDKWCDEHGTYASEHEKQELMPYPIDRSYAFVVGLNRYDDDNPNYYEDKNTHSLFFGVSTFRFDPKILASQQVICCDSLSEWNTLFHNFIQTNTLVVVEFGVSWLRPILGEIAEKTPDAIFIKVDVDEDDYNNPLKEYKVDTLPFLVFFKQGKVIDKVGNNKEELAAKVTMHRTTSA